jgi:uncharacterized protein (TIGR03067 family)
VPMTLTASTVKAAMGFAVGSTATAVSSNVAVLTQGVLKTMLLSKLKTVFVIGVLLALVGLGAGAGVFRNAVDAQMPTPSAAKEPPPAVTEPPPIATKLTLRPLPVPALLSLTHTGTIAVTRRNAFYQPVTSVNDKGQPVTSYRMVDQTTTDQYSREDVHIYDSAGKRIAAAEVSRLLKEQVTALVYSDGEKPDPLHLKLFKDGVLFVVLPVPKTPRIEPPVQAVPVVPPADPADPFLPMVTPSDPDKLSKHLTKEQLKLFKELQGEWLVVSQTSGGQKIPSETLKNKDLRFEISHGNEIRIGTVSILAQDFAARKTFMVRPGSPNQFDLITFDVDGDAKQSPGIYKLNDDELTICLALPGAERPRRFETPEGSKHTVLVLHRVPAATTPH